jgi:molybdenum cofactor cytidylyltransferase
VLHVVILAAGIAERFGSQKLVHPLAGGGTLLARAIRAAGTFPLIVVCGGSIEEHALALGARTVRNDEPERGMSYSLRLANAQIDRASPIAVLPGDLLYVEAQHVARIAMQAVDVDVVYPMRSDRTPGHPVIFSPRARERVERLADNEPIARVRDAAELTRKTIELDAAWPYRDVDRRSDLP